MFMVDIHTTMHPKAFRRVCVQTIYHLGFFKALGKEEMKEVMTSDISCPYSLWRFFAKWVSKGSPTQHRRNSWKPAIDWRMSMAIPWKNWSTSMDIHSCASWFSTFSVFFAVPSLPILFLAMTYQYIQWFQSRCRKPQDVFEMGVHINHLLGFVSSTLKPL